MNLRSLFGRAGLTALAVVSVVAVSWAAVVYTQPKPFLAGFRLIDGQALNNAISADLVTAESGIVAHAGGGGTSAYQLHAVLNKVDTVASANDSVKMPKSQSGASVTVDNDGTNTLNVYPNGTDQIEDSTGAYAILSGNDITFVSPALGKWYALGSGNQAFGSGVNQVVITGGATGVDPVITTGGAGSDTNIGILLTGKGIGPVHLGGSTLANASVRVPTVTSSVNEIDLEGAITSGVPFITVGGTSADTNPPIAIFGKGTGATYVGGVTTTLAGLQVLQTASRVNDFVLTPAATANTPGFEAGGAGADASVGVAFGTQGTGTIAFDTDTNVQQFGVGRTATAVDYLSCAGAATANPALVACTATGSDTNININLVTKAAGNVKLGTSTVSTCNGTTTATCQGQRFVVSITGLTTAASTLSAAMTVTDANVVSSASTVMCQVNLYAGTGVPVAVNVTPGTGTVAINIQNVSTGAALNATVPVACVVFGT